MREKCSRFYYMHQASRPIYGRGRRARRGRRAILPMKRVFSAVLNYDIV
jgi:hypothetical protein